MPVDNEKPTAPLMPVAHLMPAEQPAAVPFAAVQQVNKLDLAQGAG